MGLLKYAQPFHQVHTDFHSSSYLVALSVPRQHGKEEKSPELALAGGCCSCCCRRCREPSCLPALHRLPGLCSHLIYFHRQKTLEMLRASNVAHFQHRPRACGATWQGIRAILQLVQRQTGQPAALCLATRSWQSVQMIASPQIRANPPVQGVPCSAEPDNMAEE